MRERRVTRVIDARANQHRILVHLDCPHTQAISQATIAAAGQFHLPRVGETLMCPECPDPLPEPPREEDPMEAYRRACFGLEE